MMRYYNGNEKIEDYLNVLQDSVDFQDTIDPKFIRYMKINNFTYAEMTYILYIIREAVSRNKVGQNAPSEQ